ncbi:tRNA (guanine-N2-)-methyltransferase catalytic subunit Trm11 [Schizosaccharomyces japonicus yFS275]|uniref:tRNA (guanine(10)-N(2))-methyltransferase n=1 Tax=Schizosaccharomyces japonicus (strain yFS275 / FY16936) TaxID=402676 RepID=B6K653_SCHJY|nr:tRNA (guanine-N2-)-methyltransferase catalytic subunit Trm11 [Schizosaccharomyces japonicus yFS275]EEB09007.2 tRNA (guanine-N2-)-methyltransferase catalytic subunit Trm11 [Schizosaccharomyces japonicus yFS275]
MKCYILHFSSTHKDFHLPELETLSKIENVPFSITERSSNPFWIVQIEDDESARKLVKRSIFCKGVYELYGCSDTLDNLHELLKNMQPKPWELYSQTTYKFSIESYGKHLTMEEQLNVINQFGYLHLNGKVSMKSPDCIFTVLEDNEKKSDSKVKAYFCRKLGVGSRDAIDKFDLKQRRYIGITSFESELSLVTAQMAMAGPAKVVYDPFVGTGSFLYTCSFFGAHTIGSDIDGRQMRGKNSVSIRENIAQYNLQSSFLDVFTSDITHCPIRESFLLDAIVCDPPYGVRAGAKRIASIQNIIKDKDTKPILHRYPKLEHYEICDLVKDLVDFAAKRLVDEGRLVLWLPTITEEYSIDDIPKHPALRLLYNSAQHFNHWSRRLLTFERLPRATVVKNNITQNSEHLPAHYKFREKYFGNSPQ